MLWLLPGLSLKSAGGQLARPNLANMSGQRALIGLGCVSLASLAQMAGLGGMARRAWPIGRDRAGRHCATARAPRYLHPADATCVRKKTQELLQRWIRRKTPRKSQKMKMFRMPFRGTPRRAVLATWPSGCPQNAYRLYQSPKHCNQNRLLSCRQTTSQTIMCQAQEGQKSWP